jgi:hypothetical protein
MSLPKHTRTGKGTFRRERGDSLAKHLRTDYPEFAAVHGNKQLRNVKQDLGLPTDASINRVRKALRDRE